MICLAVDTYYCTTDILTILKNMIYHRSGSIERLLNIIVRWNRSIFAITERFNHGDRKGFL